MILMKTLKKLTAGVPKTPFIRRDIAKLLPSQILKATKGVKPDVFIGGPPCQGFSMMGDKHGSDPRNQLLNTMLI